MADSTNKTVVQGGGIGFLGLLTILFIGLKLAHIIHWSWWLVLLPLYVIPAGFCILAAAFFGLWGIAFCLAAVADWVVDKWKKR